MNTSEIATKLATTNTIAKDEFGIEYCVICGVESLDDHFKHSETCLKRIAQELCTKTEVAQSEWQDLLLEHKNNARMYNSMKPEQQKTLLQICREFDAIDLSEINRRLENGEKFDDACEGIMDKRQALGEEIQKRLGDLWAEFEKEHDKFTTDCPNCKQPASSVLVEMIFQKSHELMRWFNDEDNKQFSRDAEKKLLILVG